MTSASDLARAARYKAGFFRPRFTRLLVNALQSSEKIRGGDGRSRGRNAELSRSQMAAGRNDGNRARVEVADEGVRLKPDTTPAVRSVRLQADQLRRHVPVARPDAGIRPIDPHLNRPPATSFTGRRARTRAGTENGAREQPSPAPLATPTRSRPETTGRLSRSPSRQRRRLALCPAQWDRSGHLSAGRDRAALRISSDCSDRCRPRSESARGVRTRPRSRRSRRASRRRAAWCPTDRDDRAPRAPIP